MASSPVAKIGLSFLDRDSNTSKMTFYCAFSVSISDAMLAAASIASRVIAMSDAVIIGIDIAYRWTIDDPGDPGDESSIERKLLLLMVNSDDEINGMTIPSPNSENWETTGNYAGIRLDLTSAGALTWSAMLAALDLRTDDNRAVGTVLAAGGLAL
jgi:hypothetical protein